jgi:alpha-beta hydrolase superfamily lysophospholipase
VATDYVGLGTAGPHPYLVGQGEGRPVLDAVRAARHLAGVSLSDETVVWGHSQGGHAALWTALLQPTYAPDVPLRGVAALAPATDLPALVDHLDNVSIGSLFAAYVVEAYSQVYPDVRFDDVVRPGARVQVGEMATRCLSEPKIVVSLLQALLFRQTILARGAPGGAFAQRLAQNVPTGAMGVPVLVGQGEADPLILPAMQQAYVAARCADGWSIDYRTYPGRDHNGVVADDSPLVPELVRWTEDRFAGGWRPRRAPRRNGIPGVY